MGQRLNKKTDKDEKVLSRYLPTKFMLTVRVLVGAYLLYTSYSLIDGVIGGEGRDKYFLGTFMIAFAIIGILLMFFAGRDLLRGKYIGGELDAGDDTEELAADAPEAASEESEKMIGAADKDEEKE